jgi:hypothetical protein
VGVVEHQLQKQECLGEPSPFVYELGNATFWVSLERCWPTDARELLSMWQRTWHETANDTGVDLTPGEAQVL